LPDALLAVGFDFGAGLGAGRVGLAALTGFDDLAPEGFFVAVLLFTETGFLGAGLGGFFFGAAALGEGFFGFAFAAAFATGWRISSPPRLIRSPRR
jgi:hypothetical protein